VDQSHKQHQADDQIEYIHFLFSLFWTKIAKKEQRAKRNVESFALQPLTTLITLQLPLSPFNRPRFNFYFSMHTS
ncbi:MAG: hypothetical protein IIW89_05640, partial [Alistipes sp.]|nr:hypothetical protein [Alistipes sp.]